MKVRPKDDSPVVWHEHDDGTWEWGVTCAKCVAPPHFSKAFGDTRFSMRHLKAQNERGYTVREEIAEIYEGARERGADITRAR